MESQCKGDCIKFQDELWQWKNRAVVAEYRVLELEKELEEAKITEIHLRNSLKELVEKLLRGLKKK